MHTPAGSCSGQSTQGVSTRLTTSSGYLSSIVSDVTGCGRAQWPWSVVVRPGQTIRVTLYDFGLRRRRHLTTSLETTTMRSTPASEFSCHLYAVLSEPATNQSNVTVCGGQQRLSVIMTTSSHKLDVVFAHQDVVHRTPHFLIHYEGLPFLTMHTHQSAKHTSLSICTCTSAVRCPFFDVKHGGFYSEVREGAHSAPHPAQPPNVNQAPIFAARMARCYASTAYAVMRCLSVCLSVRLSRSCILLKRINVSLKFFHHRVATPF